jgi:hypothetical protein
VGMLFVFSGIFLSGTCVKSEKAKVRKTSPLERGQIKERSAI